MSTHGRRPTLQPQVEPGEVRRDCLPRQPEAALHPAAAAPAGGRTCYVAESTGVTLTDRLSVTAHVDDVTSSCARSTYAISVLRSHGMAVTALQQVFQSVVISRLTYAVPAWWGFTTSADRQHIEAILRRAVRADLWPSAATSDPPTFGDLCSSTDDELINKIVTNSNHILHALLPPPYPINASQHYSLRQRAHSLQLPAHPTHLSDCNFITRTMYKNCY